MDIKLFPTKEEWGRGDEAMDNKLSIALKTCFKNLSFVNISEFYFNGLMLRPRTTNPAFHSTIELVTKALLHLLDTESLNDQMMLKIKGSYYEKNKINLAILEFDNLFEILRN